MTKNNSKTHPIGTKKANELGLYDMSGNVWEWCNDWYDNYNSAAVSNPKGAVNGAFRVYRGNGWNSLDGNRFTTNRRYLSPSFSYNNLGFRVCSSLQ